MGFAPTMPEVPADILGALKSAGIEGAPVGAGGLKPNKEGAAVAALPGFAASQQRHFASLFSFMTSHVPHFHLLLVSCGPQMFFGALSFSADPLSAATGVGLVASEAGGAPKLNKGGAVVALNVVNPAAGEKSEGNAGAFCSAAFAPGLFVSQHGHLFNVLSFETSHVGHFHLSVLAETFQMFVAAGLSFSFSLSLSLAVVTAGVKEPNDGVKSAGIAGAFCSVFLRPGLPVSQEAHFSSFSSLCPSHVGHFHLLE
ncbi:hypothetical protein EDD21DRAFT_116581 [Dissophora ornata]|nr:hypothetical protein EDD21DRAFT_116581 [Dissophora ornata]